MKIAFVSDTHHNQRCFSDDILEANPDVLVHCGDFSNRGDDWELQRILVWFDKLPIKHKILIPGNHDGSLERDASNTGDVNVLIDQELIIEGIKFYGTPWTQRFNNWFFAYENSLEAIEKFSKIPDDTDVLISHGAPFEIMDEAYGRNLGCPHLLNASVRVNPIIHAFGHIHEGVGEQGKYINCAQKVFVKEI